VSNSTGIDRVKDVLQWNEKYMKPVRKGKNTVFFKIALIGAVAVVFFFGILFGLKNKSLFSLFQKHNTYRYGDTVELSGRLTKKQFYGAPGYGENPNIDAREIAAVLVLDSPFTVLVGEEDYEEPYKGITELQLVNEWGIVLDPYYEQKVKIKGELMGSHTGHHHTKVLLVMETIAFVSGSSPKKETTTQKKGIQEKKSSEPTEKSYTFRTYNGNEFTFNYSNNLDLIEATGYIVGERVRLKPKGEAYKNSYLISVDEPATELGEQVTLSWRDKPVQFSKNMYRRGDVRSIGNSQVVLVIFNVLSPFKLGSVYVAPWDPTRLSEALEEATLILKSLQEVK